MSTIMCSSFASCGVGENLMSGVLGRGRAGAEDVAFSSDVAGADGCVGANEGAGGIGLVVVAGAGVGVGVGL